MVLPPDERRDRAKVNAAVREGLRRGSLRPAGSADLYGVPKATEREGEQYPQAATVLDDPILNDEIVANSAVEDVETVATDQHVVSCTSIQDVVALAAGQNVVAVAAVESESNRVIGECEGKDHIVAGTAVDDPPAVGGFSMGNADRRPPRSPPIPAPGRRRWRWCH
jgi:hypothetical protein